MKVLLNGATAGTNFGDFLFAKIFQDFISNIVGADNVFWYESSLTFSDFFRKHLNYNKKYKIRNIDALVYISGGYFCGNDKCFKDYVIRFLNYFLIGFQCLAHKKPIAIIGLEVGETQCRWLRWVEKSILKKATLLVVRNEQSMQVLKSYGIYDAICTSDTAFVIDKNFFDKYSMPKGLSQIHQKKIFLHINWRDSGNENIIKKIIPVFNDFLKTHDEYAVIIGTDQYSESQETVATSIKNLIKCDNIYINWYDDPIGLCKILENVDCIITTKLHVGIVGAKLGKSVISFSEHTEKIQRLYKQLNECDRTMSLSEFDTDRALKMLEKYHNIPIKVSDEIIESAKSNFDMLKDFLNQWRNNG